MMDQTFYDVEVMLPRLPSTLAAVVGEASELRENELCLLLPDMKNQDGAREEFTSRSFERSYSRPELHLFN